MAMDLTPGRRFPDITLLDHAAHRRFLSELVGGDPVMLQFFRGWWCPKEQAFFRRLIALQDEAEVAYSLREATDPLNHPYVPAVFALLPDLTIHRAYDGYWFWGRSTTEELRRDMREISAATRADWAAPAA